MKQKASETLRKWKQGRDAALAESGIDSSFGCDARRTRLRGEVFAAIEIEALLLKEIESLEADRELLRSCGVAFWAAQETYTNAEVDPIPKRLAYLNAMNTVLDRARELARNA